MAGGSQGLYAANAPASLESAEIKFADGWQERTFWPIGNHSVGKTVISSDLGAYTVRLNDETLKEGTDYTVSGNVATGVGTYNLTIKGVSPHYSGTKTVQWKVVPHKLKGLWVTSCSKQYDGTVALRTRQSPKDLKARIITVRSPCKRERTT